MFLRILKTISAKTSLHLSRRWNANLVERQVKLWNDLSRSLDWKGNSFTQMRKTLQIPFIKFKNKEQWQLFGEILEMKWLCFHVFSTDYQKTLNIFILKAWKRITVYHVKKIDNIKIQCILYQNPLYEYLNQDIVKTASIINVTALHQKLAYKIHKIILFLSSNKWPEAENIKWQK